MAKYKLFGTVKTIPEWCAIFPYLWGRDFANPIYQFELVPETPVNPNWEVLSIKGQTSGRIYTMEEKNIWVDINNNGFCHDFYRDGNKGLDCDIISVLRESDGEIFSMDDYLIELGVYSNETHKINGIKIINGTIALNYGNGGAVILSYAKKLPSQPQEHKCKYCNTMVTGDDEECYENPHAPTEGKLSMEEYLEIGKKSADKYNIKDYETLYHQALQTIKDMQGRIDKLSVEKEQKLQIEIQKEVLKTANEKTFVPFNQRMVSKEWYEAFEKFRETFGKGYPASMAVKYYEELLKDVIYFKSTIDKKYTEQEMLSARQHAIYYVLDKIYINGVKPPNTKEEFFNRYMDNLNNNKG